jgi:hypothetical protein
MTMAGISVDCEQQSVLRTKRLRRAWGRCARRANPGEIAASPSLCAVTSGDARAVATGVPQRPCLCSGSPCCRVAPTPGCRHSIAQPGVPCGDSLLAHGVWARPPLVLLTGTSGTDAAMRSNTWPTLAGCARASRPCALWALVPFRVTQSSSTFMPLFESRRAHGARSHGPESLKPLPGLDVS